MKLNRIIIVGAATIAVCLLATSCANCDYDYNSKSVEYANDADHRVIKETTTTLKNATFSQGWSNGTGKTVDVHPQVDLLSM